MRATFRGTVIPFAVFVLSSIRYAAAQACTSDLIIDDFSNFASSTNLLGGWASDDSTMGRISASNNILSLTPSSSQSYYYTNIVPCLDTRASGYDAISFPIRAPNNGNGFILELQTSSSCASQQLFSVRIRIEGLTTTPRVVTVPLSTFTGATLGAVKAIVWSDLSTGTHEIGKLSLRCANPAPNPTPTQPTSASPSRTAVETPIPSNPGNCQPLLIDDWNSQSRLTFLYYNAMLHASSDEGTMSSIVVANNRVTLTPRSGTYSYLYSQFDCVSATNKYGGISLRIKAAAGTSLAIDLQSSSNCNPTSPTSHVLSASQLGWTFDGTEKLYSIPFNKFSGLDTGKLTAIVFQGINVPVTLGPVAFYCGNTPSEYQLPRATTTASPTATVPATTATATGFVIDRFANPNTNALGFYHGGDEPSQYSISSGRLTIRYSDADYSYYTQLSGSCRDITSLDQGYIHITYSGSTQFTIALQQHNPTCNPSVAPYPETWDVVHASRYAVSSTDIYIPLSHFSVVKSRVIGLAFKSFSSGASNPTTFSLVEFVRTIPSGISIPSKIKTAPLVFACTRPNSFAFAIDDGIPEFAQTVMSVIKSEGIKVTFFTVGAALLDESTNLTSVYREALADGHQVALHSFTHPKMEGLPATRDIEWEIKEDVAAVKQTLGIESKYFRPPFGNEGARFREALERLIPGSRLINWSVDVQDWLWGESNTPEKQLEAFQNDVAKGGNLVVLHYLYPSTVNYLREFIQIAKATGKQLMRVDQCLEDPSAPPL